MNPMVESVKNHLKQIQVHTLQGINISHLGKRKIMPFLGDMLVPWRVNHRNAGNHDNVQSKQSKGTKTVATAQLQDCLTSTYESTYGPDISTGTSSRIYIYIMYIYIYICKQTYIHIYILPGKRTYLLKNDGLEDHFLFEMLGFRGHDKPSGEFFFAFFDTHTYTQNPMIQFTQRDASYQLINNTLGNLA